MKVVGLGLEPAVGRIGEALRAPRKANITNEPVPSVGTARVARDARKSSDAGAWDETHLVMIVLSDDRIGAGELPNLVLILRRDTAGQIFAGETGSDCLRE